MTLQLAGASLAKGRVNEDAWFIDADLRLFGVFDGLGGTTQGALAAALAAEAVRDAYVFASVSAGRDGAAERMYLALAVRGAGALLAATLDDGLTTASVVKVCDGESGSTAIICNIGDSRIYRFTAAGELQQCTLDDSPFGADWAVQLRLSEVQVPVGPLEYRYFERRHVLDCALGEPYDMPRVWDTEVAAGDLLVAVTDGVTDNLTYSEMAGVIGESRAEPARAVSELVEAASVRSRDTGHPRAKIDDITAVIALIRD